MTFTSTSTLGRILRDPAASEVFFAAAPEVRDAANLEIAKGLTPGGA